MLPRLVLIHVTACNADSQRSDSQFECVWVVFSLGTSQRLYALSEMSQCLLDDVKLWLTFPSSPTFSSTLSPNCLLCSLPLNNSPPLPLSIFSSLHQSLYTFPHPSLSSFCAPPVSSLFFQPHSPFLYVLQASELGMTSAFYKYILTTMVRAFSRTATFLTSVS